MSKYLRYIVAVAIVMLLGIGNVQAQSDPTLTGMIMMYTKYLQPIITQYFIDNKSEIWLLFLIAHSKR